MTDNHMPLWEQRLRAPQIPPWTLSGASAVWPRDASTPAVVMANISGRIEAHVYTPGDTPAPLTQITDRPQGTLGAVVSPTGDAVLWFNDTAGDEVGRWVRQPLDGSAPVVLAADQPAGFMAGIAPCSDGGAVIGYLGQGGTTIVRADPDGSAHIVAEFADPGEVVAADDSDEFVLVAVAPGGDWLHMGTQVISRSASHPETLTASCSSTIHRGRFVPLCGSSAMTRYSSSRSTLPATLRRRGTPMVLRYSSPFSRTLGIPCNALTWCQVSAR
jgi:hypothetical protein